MPVGVSAAGRAGRNGTELMQGRHCRVIIDTPRCASMNMALDAAVLKAVAQKKISPTIRLYRWSAPAVTIGYFQILHEAVCESACRRDGVDVVRRITGGGAVLHEHELTYSVVIPLKCRAAGGTILDSFRDICAPVIEALRREDIEAGFKPINDIVVGSRKISGCAQTRKDGVLLQHGTLLLDINRRNMSRYLRVAREKTLENSLGLTCMKEFLGDAAVEESYVRHLSEILVAAYQDAWRIDVEYGSFLPEEIETARLLEREQFASPEWNEKRRLADAV